MGAVLSSSSSSIRACFVSSRSHENKLQIVHCKRLKISLSSIGLERAACGMKIFELFSHCLQSSDLLSLDETKELSLDVCLASS